MMALVEIKLGADAFGGATGIRCRRTKYCDKSDRKTAHHKHVRPSRNRPPLRISRLSSVLNQDRQVGRFGGFQGLPRVGSQGDGYQKLIAVIVAVCGYRL